MANLESEVKWFSDEVARLRKHQMSMKKDINHILSRINIINEQREFLSDQLKQVLKRSRVLENELKFISSLSHSNEAHTSVRSRNKYKPSSGVDAKLSIDNSQQSNDDFWGDSKLQTGDNTYSNDNDNDEYNDIFNGPTINTTDYTLYGDDDDIEISESYLRSSGGGGGVLNYKEEEKLKTLELLSNDPLVPPINTKKNHHGLNRSDSQEKKNKLKLKRVNSDVHILVNSKSATILLDELIQSR